MCIFKAVLSSLSDDWAQYEEKAPVMSDSSQNVETTCNSELKFKEIKKKFIKGVQQN